MGRRSIAAVLALTMVLAACSGEDEPVTGTAEVTRDAVAQTVAAAAVLEPVDRVTVAAPAAGEVATLVVVDGEQVEVGDPLLTLRSASLEAQLQQAEAALEATATLAGTGLTTGIGSGLTGGLDGGLEAALVGGLPGGLDPTLGAGLTGGLDPTFGAGLTGGLDPTLGAGLTGGLDLAPVVGALRAQLDAVIPPVLASLEDQIAGLEAALTAVTAAADERGQATAEALRQIADQLGGQLPEKLGIDPGLLELPDPDEVLVPVDTTELEASLADARARLQQAQDQYRAASAQLAEVEHQAAASASAQAQALADTQAAIEQAQAEAQAAAERAQAEARAAAEQAQAAAEQAQAEAQAAAERAQAEVAQAQAAAEEVQRAQAEAAVQAVRDRLDALALTAPIAGTVELSRGGDAASAGGLPGGGDLSALAGQLGGGDLGGLGGLTGDLGGGAAGITSGPVAVGSEVAAGQPLLTLFDLDAFTAEAEVDELDIVLVETGQPVVVLLDAFPEVELTGVVDRVGLEPRRSGAGGAAYPVSVRLVDVPDDLRLRIGLTASVEVEVLRTEGELVVPSSALLRRGGDEVVHVIIDGRVTRVEVEVLAIGDGTAAIAGDLDVGDTVATTGVELLEDGQEVLLEDEAAAAFPWRA